MDYGPRGLFNRNFMPAVHAAAFQDFGDGIAKCNATMEIAHYNAARQSTSLGHRRDSRNDL
jgi:hypothetical protein